MPFSSALTQLWLELSIKPVVGDRLDRTVNAPAGAVKMARQHRCPSLGKARCQRRILTELRLASRSRLPSGGL